jgi:Flp pilus assembly protein TadG
MRLLRTSFSSWKGAITSASRSERGQAASEGAVGLILLVAGLIGAIVFLIDTGLSTYYLLKLGFITNQAARYAATLDSPDSTQVKTYAQGLFAKLNFSSDKLDVAVTEGTALDENTVTVTLTNDFPIFASQLKYLPLSIKLSDRSTAVTSGGGTIEITDLAPFPQNDASGNLRNRVFMPHAKLLKGYTGDGIDSGINLGPIIPP